MLRRHRRLTKFRPFYFHAANRSRFSAFSFDARAFHAGDECPAAFSRARIVSHR